jgi:hypothetical protein
MYSTPAARGRCCRAFGKGMNLELGPQLLADFLLGTTASAFSPWKWARFVACLLIPFTVSSFAFGPGNSSGSVADGGGLFYTMFAFFLFWGLVASALGCGLGYFVRRALKLKI